MELVNLKSMLQAAKSDHYAVGAFNYSGAEAAKAIAEAATDVRSPIMFITGPLELNVLGARMLADIARSVAESVDLPVCLHLDHAGRVEMVKECLEAGFPSVMMDASQHEFEENVRLTKAVVDMARPLGVTVEGEIGGLGRADDITFEGGHEASLTEPSKAAEFVERTGVDALAVSIGNAHGIYKQRPVLDFDRLQAIKYLVDVPLVLHGGSGTPPDQLQRAIEIGITKVNVASEISRVFLEAIREGVARRNGNAYYAQVLLEAKVSMRELVARWMNDLGCAGRA